MDDISLFRIDSHESQIKALNDHASKVNTTLVTISDSLTLVNQNLAEQQRNARSMLSEMKDMRVAFNDRVKPLEVELIERNAVKATKKNFLSSLTSYIPLVLLGLILIYAVDFQKLVNLISGAGVPTK